MNEHQPNPLAYLRTFIAERRAALEQLEAALVGYDRAFGTQDESAVSRNGHADGVKRRGRVMKRTGRTTTHRITDGSLEHRILGLAKAPTPLKVIIDAAGARPGDVKRAVAQLISAKRLKRTGWARAARYQVK